MNTCQVDLIIIGDSKQGNKALKELGKSAQTAVYVGDSEVDVMTAKNSNLPCISVLWGFRGEEFLRSQGATQFAKRAEEVKKYL